MDLLKIEDKTGYFCLPEKPDKVVSQVTADDICQALELILTSGEIEIAIELDSDCIANPAQKIIFEQLRNSFNEVVNLRDSIKAEIDETFAQAEAKYLKGEQP